METIKQTLFTNWHFMRWLRLGLGLVIGIQAIQNHEPVLGLLSAFLLFQAVTNTGCCGANGCAVPTSKKPSHKQEEIEFEEL
jgi:hypothetical protein